MIFNGQGPIFMGDYDPATGKLINVQKIGCGNRVLKLTQDRSTEKIKESCSGSRATLAEYETEKSMRISLEMQEFDRKMLALALYGDTALVTGDSIGSGAPEVMPLMAAGDYYHTDNPFISAVTIKDSDVAPATLTAGTDYVIEDADHGAIKILNIGAYVQPFKAEYTYASYGNIAAFAKTGVVKGIIFDGKSTVDNQKVRVFVPRISFGPTSEFDWLGEQAATLSLEGEALYNDKLANEPLFGGFARVTTGASA